MGKIYQYDFPKATVLRRSMKGAISSSFRKDQQRLSKNAMPRQVVPSTDKIFQGDFPKAFFQSALRKSIKISKKAVLKQTVRLS